VRHFQKSRVYTHRRQWKGQITNLTQLYMKQKLFLFALLPVVALGAAAITIGTQASAHKGGNPAHIEELAEKLNIEEAQLEAAFQEIKAEHKAERETIIQNRETERAEKLQNKYEERLSKAAGDGDITEAQKQLILNKRAELIAKFESEVTALQTWSEQNDIDLRYLGLGHAGLRGNSGLKLFGKFPKFPKNSE